MARPATGPDKKKPKKAPAPAAIAKKKAAAAAPMSKRKAVAPKSAAEAAPAKKAAAKKAAAKKAAPKMAPASTKTAAKKAGPKQPAAKKLAAKSAAAKKAAPKTSAPKTSAPKTSAPKTAARGAPAKTVGVKQAAPRRIPVKVPPPATRRARGVPAAKRPRPPAAAPRSTASPAARPPQDFIVNHLNEADFKADGLRAYAMYRDLGIAGATAGLCQAHVIRFVPPTTDEVRKRHTHSVDLQLVYVLKGWIKNEFEGHGEQMMSVGSCWLQPSGLAHTVLEYSPDCEVLEIIVPADFKTDEVG